MKLTIMTIILFMFGCAKPESKLSLVAIQHVGEGVVSGDTCKTMYLEDGRDVKKPEEFKITPYEVVATAKEKLGYNCGHKLSAEILSDKDHYHIVRLGSLQDAIIIDGQDGSIVSKGFKDESQ
jgi:hypothetical protein